MEYPEIKFSGFEPMPDGMASGGGFVGYMKFNLLGEEMTFPAVFTLKDLAKRDKAQLVTMFSQLFDNALTSAHDVIDQKLKRGFYADRS